MKKLVDGFNAAIDALPEDKPPIYLYLAESSRSHPIAPEFDEESPGYLYLKENLHADVFDHLKYSTYEQFCDYFYTTDHHWNYKGSYQAYKDIVRMLGFDSVTHYQFVHFTDCDRDYLEILPDVQKEWDRLRTEYGVPYYPHVTVGWDNNPRHHFLTLPIMKNNTPEHFKKGLLMAKDYADRYNDVPLVTINSWNEWTEMSYLEPDDVYGYGYLEAVRDVFTDNKPE